MISNAVAEGAGKDHVLAAVRQLMSDGKAWTARALCEQGIAQGLLPRDTTPKYVYNAVVQSIGRQRLRGEKPEFARLPDGGFRLNMPTDPFVGHVDALEPNPELEAFIKSLGEAAIRETAPSKDDAHDIGAPFEKAVADAFARLGFVAKRLGGYEQPDVVASAPLGATAFTIAVECKSRDQGPELMVQTSAPAEAGRLRDSVGADFAVLLGPQFIGQGALDQELATHKVALWLVDDLAALLRANDTHAVEWPDLAPLFVPGRRSQDILGFCFAHLHGKWERAHITLRYVLEAGLTFQKQMLEEEEDSGLPDSPLTAEVLTELVNERLRSEGDLGRIDVEDVRRALEVAANPPVSAIRQGSDGTVTVTRALLSEPRL